MFSTYMKTASFSDKEAVGNFESLLAAHKPQVLKTSLMTEAHELLKQDSKNAKAAITALAEDPLRIARVYQAVKTHRRLRKADEKLAEQYFKQAQELYSYSTYFEGANRNNK